MATPEFLQDYAKDYAAQSKGAYSVPIDTSTFTGGVDAAGNRITSTAAGQAAVTGQNPFVAGEDALQTQAIQEAQAGLASYKPYLTAAQQAQTDASGTIGGLGALQTAAQGSTGPMSQAQQTAFMSPYQQQVIDETLRQYDLSRGQGQQSIQDAAVASGNFGGGREGAMLGQYNADTLANRAGIRSGLLQQGFQNAQNQFQQNFQNQGSLFANQGQLMQNQLGMANAQAGLGQAQLGLSDFNRAGIGADVGALGQLGSLRQGFDQANLSANQQAQQTAAYEPYGRLSQYGQGLTGLSGGVASQAYQEPQQPNMLSQSIGTAMGLGGLYGKIFQPGLNQ